MLLSAERTLYRGHVHRDLGLQIDGRGILTAVRPLAELGGTADLYLPDRLLLPGMVSSHGELLQRLLRGRELAAPPDAALPHWAQRHQERAHYIMTNVTPPLLQAVAEQVFLEMLLSGTTTAGEVHLLHAPPPQAGRPSYASMGMADALLAAAQRVGIRLSLIHTVALAGVSLPPQVPLPAHLGSRSLDAACHDFDGLIDHILGYGDAKLGWALGVASLGHLPLDGLIGLKVRLGHMPLHVPVARHPVELQTSRALHDKTPVQALIDAEICDACVTLVGAQHLSAAEATALARTGAQVAPSAHAAERGETERQALRLLAAQGVPQCLSHDARRGSSVFAAAQHIALQGAEPPQAASLLQAATVHGATALGCPTGKLQPGHWADLCAIDTAAPGLAGLDDALLLPALLWDLPAPPVSEVFVGGQLVVQEGRHPQAHAIAEAYGSAVRQLFPAA